MAKIMAIVNLTPDSFYAPSRVWEEEPSSPGCLSSGTLSCSSLESSSPTCSGISSAADKAVERILSFFRAGAAIVDLGAVSTRPGAAPVSARAEWGRLAPVLRALASLPGFCADPGSLPVVCGTSSVIPVLTGNPSSEQRGRSPVFLGKEEYYRGRYQEKFGKEEYCRGRSQGNLGKVEGAFGEGPKKGAGPSPTNMPPSYPQAILGGEGLQQKIGPSPKGTGTFPSDSESLSLPAVMPDLTVNLSGLRVSIDTTRASIVRKAYKVIGPFIVNDISAGEDDPEMLPTVADLGLPYIAMHKRGNPQTMNGLCEYPDGVMAELLRYFGDFSERARALGIRNWILDPGLGFAKTAAQNWEILEHLEELKVFGRPILVGTADKRFTKEVPPHILTAYSDGMPDQVGHDEMSVGHNGKEMVEPDGTEIADALAVAHGADILRVHRVPVVAIG